MTSDDWDENPNERGDAVYEAHVLAREVEQTCAWLARHGNPQGRQKVMVLATLQRVREAVDHCMTQLTHQGGAA